jgi:hypothetical protein
MARSTNEGGRRHCRLPDFGQELGDCFGRVAYPRGDVTLARLAEQNEVLS